MNKLLAVISIVMILLILPPAQPTNAQSLDDQVRMKPDVTVQFNALVSNVNMAYNEVEDEEELKEYFRSFLPTLISMSDSIVQYGQEFPITRLIYGTIEEDAWSTLTILWFMGELALDAEDFFLATYSFTGLQVLHEEYPNLEIHEGVDADYIRSRSLFAISSIVNAVPDEEN